MKLNTQRDKEVWNRSRKDAIDEMSEKLKEIKFLQSDRLHYFIDKIAKEMQDE